MNKSDVPGRIFINDVHWLKERMAENNIKYIRADIHKDVLEENALIIETAQKLNDDQELKINAGLHELDENYKKIEDLHNESQTEIKKIDSERKLFAEQYEKYLHLCSDQSNHIKELEQQIKDMEYKEKYL